MLTVALWNLGWRTETSASGRAGLAILDDFSPDILCLAETHLGFGSLGHDIVSGDDYGLGPQRTRRKVILSSRRPWRSIDHLGSSVMPSGRFVAAETETAFGPVRVIGVCVPWRMAAVSTGMRDKQPWEQHRRFLDGLQEVMGSEMPPRTIVLGDFNQRLLRGRGVPPEVHRQFRYLFGDDIAVASAGTNETAIDHCFALPGLKIVSREVIERRTSGGIAMSDHDGLIVRLEPNAPK
jgi:endonuclease/exonuclease/phosphatase family metal-dependent hydrolase